MNLNGFKSFLAANVINNIMKYNNNIIIQGFKINPKISNCIFNAENNKSFILQKLSFILSKSNHYFYKSKYIIIKFNIYIYNHRFI